MTNIGVKILGLGMHVPETGVTNEDLANFLETSDEWITTRPWIKERRVIKKGEDSVTLGIEAAKKAIENAKIDVNEIDAIICATSCPKHLYPSTACEIQKALNIKNAFGYDITAACTGFIYALDIAQAYIQSGKYKNILIVATDANTRFTDWKDRSVCVLFGDGAGAMVLGKSSDESNDILGVNVKSDGNIGHYITLPLNGEECPIVEHDEKTPQHITMLGKDVYKFVVSTIPQFIVDTIEDNGLKADDIDYLVPHQANIRIIEAMQSRLNYDDNKVIVNIQHYGNTSAASVPIALYEGIKEGKIKTPSKLILCAFGAGMTWGAAIINLDKGVC